MLRSPNKVLQRSSAFLARPALRAAGLRNGRSPARLWPASITGTLDKTHFIKAACTNGSTPVGKHVLRRNGTVCQPLSSLFTRQHTIPSAGAHSLRPLSRAYQTYYHRRSPLDKLRAIFTFVAYEVRERPRRFAAIVGTISFSVIAYRQYYQDVVPYSGRKRVMDVSYQEETNLGMYSFKQIESQYHGAFLPANHQTVHHVEAVGMKVVNNLPVESPIRNLEWEFFVVQSEEVNAFVLPGGKVFVFTGILPVIQDEYGLVTVLAHEIGHVVARHGAERWSKMRWLQLASWVSALVVDQPRWIFDLFLYFLLALPFSRQTEAEADYIGLMLMARAGYDPRKAPLFWARFMKVSQSSPGGAFKYLSTHPSHEERINNLNRWMPLALQEYQKREKHHLRPLPSPTGDMLTLLQQ